MIEPYETEKQCRKCGACKPASDFYTERATCKPCVNQAVVQRRKERANGVPAQSAPTDFYSIPVHEYTEADRAWQAANLPVFNRGPLIARIAA